MPYFVEAWSLAALLIFGLGLAGIGVVAPFADDLPFAFLAAPLVGVVLLPLIANTLYSDAGLSYRESLVVAVSATATTLLVQARRLPWRRGLLQLVAAATFVSLLMLLLCDARSILLGGPAIFFKYGTDQSGYAVMGDWLLHFPIQSRPVNDGGVWPYQSFPEILFNIDPRFGTFGFLALVSAVARTDSLFAYPLTTAVVIGCSALSCSAVFSRRVPVLLLCFGCLLASQWIDYGYVGFLGRIFAYPAVILLAGFALLAFEGGPGRVAALVAIAGGAGTVYPGFVVGILAGSILLPCIVMRRFGGDRAALSSATILAVAVAIGVPFLSSGTASRPMGVGQILDGLDWRTVLPRVLDIDDRSLPMTGFTPDRIMILSAVGVGLAAILLAVALVQRRFDAIGFIVGPLAFVAVLMATGRMSSVQEFAGFPYPAFVIGGVLLAEAAHGFATLPPWAALALGAAIRLPRLCAVVSTFGYAPDPDFILTQAEVGQIGRDVAGRTVEIETGTDVGRALWLMPEFGQLAGQVWWAPDTWRTVLAYRSDWTYKGPPAPLRLRLREDLTNDVYHHFTLESVAP